MIRSLTLHRALRLGLLIIALVMVSSVASKPAMAKTKSCADQVIGDWYDDGKVSKIYPLHCYTEAIAKLPADILAYSNAKEQIGRALAFAKQGKPDPGGSDDSPGSTTTTDTTKPNTGTTATTTTRTNETPPTTADTDTTETAVPPTDTSGPSSVPVPLLVLGGLAVLLLAAGSAGYLRRRMNGDDDADGTPPAAPPVA